MTARWLWWPSAPTPRPARPKSSASAVSRASADDEAEFAIVISDDQQKQGLGTELLRRLIDIGKREGVKAIVADILAENGVMQKIAEKLGFKLQRELGETSVLARLEL